MNKETENPSIITLEGLMPQGKDQWTLAWQDPKFIKALPKDVQRFIEEKGRAKLSQEQRENAFRFGFQSYMESSQKVGKNLFMNNKGEVGPYNPSGSNVEPQSKAGTATFLIWGLNLTTKEYVATTIFEVSQELSVEKKGKLYGDIFCLLINNSVSREWIKTNNLDVKSGVDWDEVVPYIGLFPYRSKQRLPIQFREDLNLYTPKALEQFILYCIEYINIPPSVNRDKNRFNILIGFGLMLRELNPEVRASINPELLNQVESLLAKSR